MGSVADQIAKITEPVPQLIDFEDELNLDSNAKISEKVETTEDNEIFYSSSLRQKTQLLLHETDSKYAGERISRKSLEEYGESESSDIVGMDDDDENESESVDEDIDSFNDLLFAKDIMQERLTSGGEEFVGSESSSEENSDDRPGSESEEYDEHGMIQQFSEVNVATEVEKGKAVQSQQELWNRLCECRIKLQKLIIAANRLPQYEMWNKFKERMGESYNLDLNKGSKTIKNLLKDFVDFQGEFLKMNVQTLEKSSDKADACCRDEEVLSDECDGSHVDTNQKEETDFSSVVNAKRPLKRKLDSDDFDKILMERHQTLVSYRNSVIQNWDRKTRLTSGRLTQKSFNMFDQSTLDQINQILLDKQRLLKRTQIMRAGYQVLGKFEKHVEEPVLSGNEETTQFKRVSNIKDHDPEIFDDEDFYRNLLKDIIECKSVGMDPVMLNKQLEIQKARARMKRKVDTKASKGRKIRYDVHTKLVNFMAPIVNVSMPSDAKDELFKSVFGQHKKASVPA